MSEKTNLFTPFNGAGLELANRIVMAPMTRRKSPGGVPGEDVAAYYRRRAEGGVGLIITEGTTIGRPAASSDEAIPNIHSPESILGWKHVVDGVHAAGGKIAVQLWHMGLRREPGTGPEPSAPSEGPSSEGAHSHAMTDSEIADAIEAFAQAAQTARAIGFNAVEIHGAHGYLVDQFFWEATNRRTDSYAGSIAGRTRFATEIVKAIRNRVRYDFTVSLRFSQWKVQDYSSRLARTPGELEQLLIPLADAGVSIFHASTRRFWEPEFTDSSLNLAGWAKKITGLPAMTVGSIGLEGPDFLHTLHARDTDRQYGQHQAASLDSLLHRLGDEEFDLVAVGRALAADPNWVRKVRDGAQDSIVTFEQSTLAELI
ncbi:2,4-dienoyl-CoA reductase [Burkholderia sp. WP9]|uniref:NADH:flavin oxidoreductase n=1 Tax=Burkholderia sp. WP9 TaxID=1500263 RepID=UPI000896964A|nr:NADH:flavin oxidoreductase [Burkholderia sp. WP9]SEC09548.1 2,4-dienoyl-CoA reductase [Burkholderia sp. WP9]